MQAKTLGLNLVLEPVSLFISSLTGEEEMAPELWLHFSLSTDKFVFPYQALMASAHFTLSSLGSLFWLERCFPSWRFTGIREEI